MTNRRAPALRGIALALLAVAWAVVAHLGSTGAGHPDLNVLAGGGPLVFAVVVFCSRWRPPFGGALALLVSSGLTLNYWAELRANVPLLYLLQQAGINLALAALFGRTLLPPAEPLITTLAGHIHGRPLSPAKISYTRQVTLAWTLFFIANVLVSLLLFWLATPVVWSIYANFLGLPLIAAMFVGEHLVRRRVLPPGERPSINDVLRAWREHRPQS